MSYRNGVLKLRRELARIERSVASADLAIRAMVADQISYYAPELIRATRSGSADMLRSAVAELRDRIAVITA
jgi:hypothetical protein